MINRNSHLISLLAALAALSVPFATQAQTSISEDFSGRQTQNSWWFFNGACLTASTLPGQEPTVSGGVGSGGQIPGCTTIATTYYNKSSGEHLVGGFNGTFPDPSNATNPLTGQGALRFTNGFPYGYSENGGIVFATPFPTGQGVSITFKTVTYLGDSGGGGGDGADGMSFVLMDATQLNTATITGVGSGDGNGLGSWGGSLGYTCSNSNTPFNGLIGGYLGLGIDEYGNFLNGTANTLGESGTTASGDNTASGGGYQPGRIGIRGAGNIAWATLNGAYGGTSNPGNSKPYYPNSLATSCQINGGSYNAGTGLCSGNPTDAMAAVQNTCATGTLWNYRNASNPTNVGATSLTNPVNIGSGTVGNPGYIAPILDYTAQPSGYVVLPVGTKIANEAATIRSAATPIFYALQISQNGLLSLSYSINGGAYTSVIKGQNITTANGPLPANFLFGFAGSTGGDTNIHEILCFKANPANSSSASAGVSEKQSAKVETGTQVYFAYYNPSADWTGRVTASSLSFDTYGNVIISPTANWDADCVLTGVLATGTCNSTGVAGYKAAEAPTSRVILSWNGATGIPFEYTNLTAAQQTAITAGDVATSQCNSSTAYLNTDRVAYLRGDRSCEISTAGVGLYRRRESVLADIVDSSPAWVGPPIAPYTAVWADRINAADPLPENGGSAQSYPAFITAVQTRLNVVYVGSDDGLVHGFRSGSFDVNSNFVTTGNDGTEVLAYMPGAVVQTIHNSSNSTLDFSNSQYGHNFFVDATPATGDVFYQNQWHTLLVGGLGPGGAALYALDVTNPSTTNFAEGNAASLVIGEWTPSTISCFNNTPANCGNNLGNTYGTPQLRRLHDGKWAVIFGNGLGSSTGDAGIFVMTINPNTAAKTFYYLSTHTGSVASPNGIAFPAAADLDGDHITDYVYAGDIQGNVWRFDLTSATETNWAVTAGPVFKSPAGQPITTGIVVASGAPSPGMQAQIMLLFGTGQKFPLTALNAASYATGTQSLYGVWDWNMSAWNTLSANATYASLTAASTGLSSTNNYAVGQANLQQQVVTINATTQDRDVSSTATVCWAGQTGCTGAAGKFGWYINLPGAQEQVIYSPELVSQALTVNTIVPAPNNPTSCASVTDNGFTYVLKALTGAPFNEVFLPPSEAANPTVSGNAAYTDPNAIGLLTNATGSSFITSNTSGTQYLVYETNQTGANGALTGGTLGLNLPPNTTGRRLSWVERR
ncbi:MAG TPA: PilC/PilY family type IV pilus protein [Steroidobacteraceae bacterium]|nr:PilC/PilY family type IV pilus protein [Steroidobacteraceae bacterium]